MVSSEIKQPQRNLPRALIFGTLAVMLTYLVINLAYFHVLSPLQVSHTDQVAATMMATLFGSAAARAITVAVMISILAALNGSILSGARVPYAMARDGYFFAPVATVHPTYRTPGVSMIVLCALVVRADFERLVRTAL